jgi:hypothetical protein
MRTGRDSRRARGHDSPSAPYAALAATVVVPVVAVVVLGLTSVVLRLLVVLGSLAVLCLRLGRRQAAAQADSVDGFGSAVDAVLFLRPFQGEQAPFSQSDDRHGRHPLTGAFVDPNEEFLSFERYVGPELTARVGPIIGLGAPGDRLPPEGPVVRHYASDLTWHEDMARLIPVVRCIVMLPQTSQPLRDELQLIRDHHVARKLFLVLGPYQELGVRTPLWADLVPVFAEHGLFLPTLHPGPGSVLGFRPDGRAVVRASGLDRGADYAAAIADGLTHDS